VLRHTGDIVLKGGGLITRLSRVEAEELSKSRSVLGILMDTKLDVLAEGRVELLELITVFGDFIEHLQGLLDNVLLDNLHDLVLLKSLTGQVERKILRVNNTLDESEPLWNQVSAIISDEDTADIELDVVLGSLGLEKVEWCTLWNEKDSTEFKLTLNGEVLDGKVVFPVVRKGLVEGSILLSGDVSGVSGPDGLGLVELLLSGGLFFNLLGLLLFVLIFIDLLDLGLLILTLLNLLFIFIRNLLLDFLGDMEEDWIRDELTIGSKLAQIPAKMLLNRPSF